MQTTEQHSPAGQPESTGPAKAPARRRLGAIVGAGLLAGLLAAAIGGVAGAQTVGTTVLTEVDQSARSTQLRVAQDGELGGPSAEDDAVWAQFDQCLVDAGVDFEALDAAEEAGEESAIDFDALDAAFESCESVLDNLSDDFEMYEISPEDEAVFERYDQCLVDNGVDFDKLEAEYEALEGAGDEAAIEVFELDAGMEAAFEACDPILETLSDEALYIDEGDFDEDFAIEVSPEDEALFEQYDQCLVDNGVDFEELDAAEAVGDESAIDFDALEAAFEACDPILESLSEDLQMFMPSPEDEAVFERFDQCLVDNGVDFEAMESEELDAGASVEVFAGDEATLDAAFDACEPILDELSDELLIEIDEFDEFDD